MDIQQLRSLLGDWEVDGQPLYISLAAAVERTIVEGALPAGTRLPAERRLAQVLAVSRGTVVAAYDELRNRAVVRTRHGSGTVVAEGASPFSGPQEARLAAVLAGSTLAVALVEGEPDLIDLGQASWWGTDDLPADTFTLDGPEVEAVLAGHGYHPAGLPELRQALADYITAHGVPTTPEQVMVTSGAQQATYLVSQLLLDDGDVVLLEDLTYPTALAGFSTCRARLRSIALGPDGLDVDRVIHAVERGRPRMTYLMPGMHNPTGTFVPEHAARRLAEAAAGWDTVLVDDRSVAPLWLDEPPPPPLASFRPEAARLVTIGSLSKWAWGGLRIGWVRANETMITRLARLKAHDDIGASATSQLVALRLLARADEVGERRRAELRRRHDAAVALMATHLPDWTWRPPAGGLCLWAKIPRGSSLDLVPLAARRGVNIVAGTANAPLGGAADHVRVPYGLPPDQLELAIGRLGEAWRDMNAAFSRTRPVEVLL